MKKNKVVFFIFILAGLLIINYPFLSQWINRRNESRIIYDYQETIRRMEEPVVRGMYSDAEAYNRSLKEGEQDLTDGFSDVSRADEIYEELLNPQGDGVMCYLEIADINVFLPVYHGTGTEELERGAGHLYGSSLPVGGEGTHAVLAAHRGLASKALFTDLDQMEEGMVFHIYVLGEKLSYRVDRISTVTPEDTELLEIEEGKDYVTLVTCTPYGINSHRLLVRGSRISPGETEEAGAQKAESGFGAWERRFFKVSALILIFAGIILLRPEKQKGEKK